MKVKDLLRCRQQCIGFAMCMIVLYHLSIDSPFPFLEQLKTTFYGGVDLCLFASGIGCYHSLDRNPDIGTFMKKRFQRLAPTYLVFIFFWLMLEALRGNFTIHMALGNILGIQNFTGLGSFFNWYISAILLFYLLAPYLKQIADRTTAGSKWGFLLLFVLASVPFWGSHTYIITVTRLPVFYLGVLFGQYSKTEQPIPTKFWGSAIAALLVGAAFLSAALRYAPNQLWSNGLYWYPFILIAPALYAAVSALFHFLNRTGKLRLLDAALTVIGDYSFEVYLVHISVVDMLNLCAQYLQLQDLDNLISALAVVLTAVGCFVLRRLVKLCTCCCRALHKSITG